MRVILKFHKCSFTKLKDFYDAYIYAITEKNELIYIGMSTVEKGVYNDVHHNRKQFRWNRNKITIWPAHILNRRRSKSLIKC